MEDKVYNKEQAKKDVRLGALCLIGGLIILIFFKYGYFFWGPTLYGGIKFINGLLKLE